MFDPGEEPDLVAAQADPGGADLYQPDGYIKQPVERLPMGVRQIWVRIAMDPSTAGQCSDTLTLASSDGAITLTQHVSDKPYLNDQTVDLLFEGIEPRRAYELSAQDSATSSPQAITGPMSANAVAMGPDPAPSDEPDNPMPASDDDSGQVAVV